MNRRTVLLAIVLVVSVWGVARAFLLPPSALRVAAVDLTLADVTVVNPGAERREHQTVQVHDGRIVSISPYVRAASSVETGPYSGCYALPGLIDMHVHHPVGRLPTDIKYFDLLHLSYGVTTVRDTGSVDGSTLRTRQQIADGEFPGPRLFACGPIIDGDPPAWPGAQVAHNAAEASEIVDDIAASGADCIKVYSRLSRDALQGARAGATRHHLTLVGHTPFAVPFEQAHLDDVQHLTGVPGMPEGAEKLGLIAGILYGWDTIGDARIDSVVKTSLEQKLVHTPTIVVIQQLLRLRNYPELLDDPAAALLPRYYRELIWKPGSMFSWAVPPISDAQATRILQNFGKVVRRLHEAGVTLHVGTDTFNPFVVPGVSMYQELRNFVNNGFTPEQALEAATRQNGESLPLAGLGVIREGSPADILVFGRDPTKDLAALSSLQLVIAAGRPYTKAELDGAIGRYRSYYSGWLFDRLTMLVFPLFARSASSE